MSRMHEKVPRTAFHERPTLRVTAPYDLGVFGFCFPKLPQWSHIYKTAITKPSDNLSIIVRPHLVLNEELKILDYFSCVPAHDLGYSGPVSSNCPNTRVPVEQV